MLSKFAGEIESEPRCAFHGPISKTELSSFARNTMGPFSAVGLAASIIRLANVKATVIPNVSQNVQLHRRGPRCSFRRLAARLHEWPRTQYYKCDQGAFCYLH